VENKKMKKRLLATGILAALIGGTAGAGTLVADAVVTTVFNSRVENDSSFVVYTQGGTGPCTNGLVIAFYPTGGSDADKVRRAYAAALLALTTGYRVTISNDNNTTCTAAVHIAVSAP
jgi:hypothetical protein